MTEKPRIVATRLMTPSVEARLADAFDALTNPEDATLDAAEIVARARGRAGLVVTATETLDAGLIAALPDGVKAIATVSVGYDHIDVAAARARGIRVGNTPDVLTDATADATFLCLLGAARLAQEAEATLRAGRWTRWAMNDFLGMELRGKRLGILGMGRIGQGVARRASGFDMTVSYHNRRRLAPEREHGARFEPDFRAFLAASDILAVTCPLTARTRGLIDAEAIAALPDGAVLVNTARGPILDEDAVLAALHAGKLKAVGLDVFAREPDIDPRWLAAPRAFILPHIGSATLEARDRMGHLALDNLAAALAGDPMPAEVT